MLLRRTMFDGPRGPTQRCPVGLDHDAGIGLKRGFRVYVIVQNDRPRGLTQRCPVGLDHDAGIGIDSRLLCQGLAVQLVHRHIEPREALLHSHDTLNPKP